MAREPRPLQGSRGGCNRLREVAEADHRAMKLTIVWWS